MAKPDSIQARVELDAPSGSHLELPASRALRALDVTALHHASRGMRDPRALYGSSIGKVWQRFRLLHEALEVPWPGDPGADSREWDETVLEKLDALLDALMEHCEDIDNVTRSFFSSNALWGASPRIRAFKLAAGAYRNHIGKVDNFLKHGHGRLRGLTMHTASGTIHGYWVEAPFDVTGLGPASLIHDGGDTAFSYNRDLRLHVANVVILSSLLANLICDLAGMELEALGPAASEDKPLFDILEWTAKLPLIVFPDEPSKLWPETQVTGHRTDDRHVIVSVPAETEHPAQPVPPFSLAARMAGDGVTKKFRVPYRVDRWSKPVANAAAKR